MSACKIARHVHRRHYSVVCVAADALLGMCVVTHAACVTPASPDFGVYEVPHAGVMCGGTCGARRRHRSCHTHGYSGRRKVTSAHGASSHASSHTTKSRAAVDEKRDASVVHATSTILAGYTCGVTSAHGASSCASSHKKESRAVVQERRFHESATRGGTHAEQCAKPRAS